MLNEALMSSESEHWNTPGSFITLVRAVAPIALDPCSNEGSLVQAERSICLPEDGIKADWFERSRFENQTSAGLVYVNPPYGSKQRDFLRKCAAEADRGCEIVALIPARTDTMVFQRTVFATAQAICFYAGRLKFEGAPSSAPFPSAVVYWGQRRERFNEVFASYGKVINL